MQKRNPPLTGKGMGRPIILPESRGGTWGHFGDGRPRPRWTGSKGCGKSTSASPPWSGAQTDRRKQLDRFLSNPGWIGMPPVRTHPTGGDGTAGGAWSLTGWMS